MHPGSFRPDAVGKWSSSSISWAGDRIKVSAAISLKNVFEEAGKVYEAKNRGVKVVFNFGASGDLIQQIEGGAQSTYSPSQRKRIRMNCQAKG